MAQLKQAQYDKQQLYRTSPPASTPHLRVFPPTLSSISHSVHGQCEISLNLSRPGKFQAFLVVTPMDVPDALNYVVPLTAYGEAVELVLNKVDPLDFGTIPYGKKKTITRVLTNKGRVPSTYAITSKCNGIVASPHYGTLAPHQSVVVHISFLPNAKEDLRHQQQNGGGGKESGGESGARVQPPLTITGSHAKRTQRIQVYGNGGTCQLQFSTDTMEFDRCMLRRPTTKTITLTNSGTATLTVLSMTLNATESTYSSVFRQGDTWPASVPFDIHPRHTVVVPIVFEPPLQQQFTGLFTLETANSSGGRTVHEVLVRGQGRAVDLVVSTDALSFIHTIVGNSYSTSLQVKNTGDLPYKLSMAVVAHRGDGEDARKEEKRSFLEEKELSLHVGQVGQVGKLRESRIMLKEITCIVFVDNCFCDISFFLTIVIFGHVDLYFWHCFMTCTNSQRIDESAIARHHRSAPRNYFERVHSGKDHADLHPHTHHRHGSVDAVGIQPCVGGNSNSTCGGRRGLVLD
jgi:hypothetical protein